MHKMFHTRKYRVTVGPDDDGKTSRVLISSDNEANAVKAVLAFFHAPQSAFIAIEPWTPVRQRTARA